LPAKPASTGLPVVNVAYTLPFTSMPATGVSFMRSETGTPFCVNDGFA